MSGENIGRDPRNNVTSLEEEILEKREAYWQMIREYSKDIEEDRARKMDISDLKKILRLVKQEYERLGNELEKLNNTLN